jgi:hypothetical protein
MLGSALAQARRPAWLLALRARCILTACKPTVKSRTVNCDAIPLAANFVALKVACGVASVVDVCL